MTDPTGHCDPDDHSVAPGSTYPPHRDPARRALAADPELARIRRERRQQHRATPVDATDQARHGSLLQRLRRAYLDEADPMTETLMLTWASFGATFGAARLITHGIRGKWLPFARNMSVGGRHLHHYNIGIAVLAGVGMVAVRGSGRSIRHPVTGLAYGSGAALIADEAALLLDLEDVYWSEKGRTSVEVAAGVLAVLGVYIAGVPFWRDSAHEVHRGVRSV